MNSKKNQKIEKNIFGKNQKIDKELVKNYETLEKELHNLGIETKPKFKLSPPLDSKHNIHYNQ